MLLKEEDKKIDLFQDWPKHYYEMEDSEERQRCLLSYLEQHPYSKEDHRRHEIYKKRFGNKNGDGFMRAWMMLKMKENEGRSFLLRKRQQREVFSCLRDLCILDETCDELLIAEWQSFAHQLIRSYASSPVYRSAVFGMASVGEKNTAKRIAHEIIEVTEVIPSSYGYTEETACFQQVFKESYLQLITNGEQYWQEAQEECI